MWAFGPGTTFVISCVITILAGGLGAWAYDTLARHFGWEA